MLIVVLLGLGVALAALEQPLPLGFELPPWLAGPAVAVYLVVAAALAAGGAAATRRSMADGQSSQAVGTVKRQRLLAAAGHAWLIVGSAGVMSAGYRSLIVGVWRLVDVPLVSSLAAWAPFVAALLITWVLEYSAYRAIRLRAIAAWADQQPPRRIWSRREFLLFNARHHLLMVLVPVGMIVLLSDCLELYICPHLSVYAAQTTMLLGSLVAATAVFLVSPIIIVRIWRTSSLPASELRAELEALCRQMKLRYRDILVWHSGDVIANAAVMGLIGRARYVLISDALLANLDPPAVRSIFAHEAGHIRHQHILHSAVFAVAGAALCAAAVDWLATALDLSAATAQAAFLAMLAGVWAVGFGWVSKRFEWQCDATAAYLSDPAAGDGRITPGGAMIFAYALQRVAQLNGIPLNQRNWRHGSIAARIARVMRLGESSAPLERVNLSVRVIKLLLWLALVVGVAANVIQALLATPATAA